ncbi:hypothetical protein GN956_G20284 [Arapaima gigas]
MKQAKTRTKCGHFYPAKKILLHDVRRAAKHRGGEERSQGPKGQKQLERWDRLFEPMDPQPPGTPRISSRLASSRRDQDL